MYMCMHEKVRKLKIVEILDLPFSLPSFPSLPSRTRATQPNHTLYSNALGVCITGSTGQHSTASIPIE